MTFRVSHAAWLAGWVLAAFGVLQIERIPGNYGHSLCGVWGCFPPLQALVAMHLFWAVLLAPLLIWILGNWSQRGRWWASMLFLAIGFMGIGFILFKETLVWGMSVPPEFRKYLPQRFAFSLATLSDWPLVQVVIVGIVCRLSVSRKKWVGQTKPGEVEVTETVSGAEENPPMVQTIRIPLEK